MSEGQCFLCLYIYIFFFLWKSLGSTIAWTLNTSRGTFDCWFHSFPDSAQCPSQDVPSRCSKNLPVASQPHCSEAEQPEGLLPACCINYAARSSCSCKFNSVLTEVSRLLVGLSAWRLSKNLSEAWKFDSSGIVLDYIVEQYCATFVGMHTCKLKLCSLVTACHCVCVFFLI